MSACFQLLWSIFCFGGLCFAQMEAADILVYVKRSPLQHYWWVGKRLLISPFQFPAGASVWKGTISSWHYLGLSPLFWNDGLDNKLSKLSESKRLFRIHNQQDVESLIEAIRMS